MLTPKSYIKKKDFGEGILEWRISIDNEQWQHKCVGVGCDDGMVSGSVTVGSHCKPLE